MGKPCQIQVFVEVNAVVVVMMRNLSTQVMNIRHRLGFVCSSYLYYDISCGVLKLAPVLDSVVLQFTVTKFVYKIIDISSIA
jgi:hypothetical protein